jgi:site-specific DNA-methyltransferase (adenine-specific)
LEFQKPHPSVAVHPTQKPVDLYEYLIRTYTNEGDTVLDFCMGSGTTGVAALRQFRNFIGIEKRPEYFKIAEERIEFVNLELQYAEAMLNNEKVQ